MLNSLKKEQWNVCYGISSEFVVNVWKVSLFDYDLHPHFVMRDESQDYSNDMVTIYLLRLVVLYYNLSNFNVMICKVHKVAPSIVEITCCTSS